MSKLNLDEGIKSIVGVLGRITQRLEKNVNHHLDFGIADDLSEALQAAVRRRPDLLVRVSQHCCQRWDDIRKTESKLIGVKVGHGTQGVAGTLLTAPLLLIETIQEDWQDLLNTIRTQCGEAGLGCI